MLAQNVIFPSIAPSHVPTPSPSLYSFLFHRYLTAPKIMPTETVSPNEVHKSGSRSPFSCVVRLRTIFIHFLRSDNGLRE